MTPEREAELRDDVKTWADHENVAMLEALDAMAEERARAERADAGLSEAREWVRRLTRQNVLTCVYCGHEYPPGTHAANDETLRSHIAQCEKHPLRTARADTFAEAYDRLVRILSDNNLGAPEQIAEFYDWLKAEAGR